MSKQTKIIVAASVAIGALAWVDPLFLALITLGPLASGLVAGARGVEPRLAAAPWFLGGLLMLVSDFVINHEDVAFHALVAILTAGISAAAAVVGRQIRARRRALA